MLPNIHLSRSAAVSLSSPRALAALRTGLGPLKLAHGALEKVEHGGDSSIAWNSWARIRVSNLCLPLLI